MKVGQHGTIERVRHAGAAFGLNLRPRQALRRADTQPVSIEMSPVTTTAPAGERGGGGGGGDDGVGGGRVRLVAPSSASLLSSTNDYNNNALYLTTGANPAGSVFDRKFE